MMAGVHDAWEWWQEREEIKHQRLAEDISDFTYDAFSTHSNVRVEEVEEVYDTHLNACFDPDSSLGPEEMMTKMHLDNSANGREASLDRRSNTSSPTADAPPTGEVAKKRGPNAKRHRRRRKRADPSDQQQHRRADPSDQQQRTRMLAKSVHQLPQVQSTPSTKETGVADQDTEPHDDQGPSSRVSNPPSRKGRRRRRRRTGADPNKDRDGSSPVVTAEPPLSSNGTSRSSLDHKQTAEEKDHQHDDDLDVLVVDANTSNNPAYSQALRAVQMAKLRKSYTLSLTQNRCLSTIPPLLFEMTQLKWLNLNNNGLVCLPPHVARLSHLNELHLHHNCLSRLPAQVTSLKFLQTLTVNNNRFSSVPHSWDYLGASLRTLNLSHNNIRRIPRSFTRLVHLSNLDVSHNKICYLPCGLALLPDLRKVNLIGNPLLQGDLIICYTSDDLVRHCKSALLEGQNRTNGLSPRQDVGLSRSSSSGDNGDDQPHNTTNGDSLSTTADYDGVIENASTPTTHEDLSRVLLSEEEVLLYRDIEDGDDEVKCPFTSEVLDIEPRPSAESGEFVSPACAIQFRVLDGCDAKVVVDVALPPSTTTITTTSSSSSSSYMAAGGRAVMKTAGMLASASTMMVRGRKHRRTGAATDTGGDRVDVDDDYMLDVQHLSSADAPPSRIQQRQQAQQSLGGGRMRRTRRQQPSLPFLVWLSSPLMAQHPRISGVSFVTR